MPSVGVAAFIFRICANIFFSGMLGLVCWIAARLILISFFDFNADTDRLTSIIAIGIGTGFGGSIGAFTLSISPVLIALRALLGIGVGLLGAWLGLQYGRDVYIMPGMPGIPELGGIVRGAMIAANALPIATDLGTAARSYHQRRALRNEGVTNLSRYSGRSSQRRRDNSI